MLVSDVHGSIGDLGGVLELLIDKAAVADIVADLHATVDDLAERQAALLPVSANAYGASPAGAAVRGHTDKAYTAINEALVDMNKAIEHYIASMKGLVADGDEADAASAAEHAAAMEHLAAGSQYGQAAGGEQP